jgi:hypothetical protein
VARGKFGKSKKVAQHLPVSTSNRFSTLNEVIDEIEQRKEARCPKVNVKKNNKLLFYSDGYGRGIPTSLSKINDDISVYGEVRPGARVKEVLKNCVRDCAVMNGAHRTML